ncbi:MAG: 50S ribosomal protein L15 [Anaeroplasmataceae bacterium]
MLNELKPVEGARHSRKRLGRGTGSGLGKTSGKGNKGQNARSGGGVRPGFEGGQIPFFQRLPKRGFKNVNRKEYAIVNLADLEQFENGTKVTLEMYFETGLVKKVFNGIKVLGEGTLTKKLTVQAHKFSAAAKEAIEAAGGTVEVI